MKTAIYKTALVISFFTLGVLQLRAEAPKRNSIIFFEVDDWVEVFVDGKKVFRQAAAEGDLDGEVEFDLNPFIQGKIDPIVEIRLTNANCHTCEAGNGWRVEFEVYQEDESVDYIIEEGDSMGGNVVFTIEYEWGYI
ncbi:MAG: hypothetical protein ABJO02_10470 [Reichenbachiella sp.]|uniref:hypothetical protein n=1 Tax=Reichenbachiella sp. TaxID=2184521 RepID=UPI0029675A75|nr:hypothetical protein [Reichenbachiella sp.]MDW3209263.1 hypothetical protein [Reichenbachiella sp.]